MSKSVAIELMIMSGPDDGTLLKLAQPRSPNGYIIGRREDCDVILPFDSQISRNHARLYRQDAGWCVEDLGSKNGTYVGKQRLEGSRPLEPGQMFRMGRTWLRLQAETPSGEEHAPSADNADAEGADNDGGSVARGPALLTQPSSALPDPDAASLAAPLPTDLARPDLLLLGDAALDQPSDDAMPNSDYPADEGGA